MRIEVFIISLIAVACFGILIGGIMMRKCIVASWWAVFAIFMGFFYALAGAVIGAIVWFVLFVDMSGDDSRIIFLVFSLGSAFGASIIGSARNFEWVLSRTMHSQNGG